MGEDELPRTFQDTMSAFGQDAAGGAGAGLESRFFDILHLDGDDLIDRPLAERLATLERVAGPWRIPGVITTDAAEAQRVLDEALAHGHEGVMVKDAASPYEAGRRGGAWRKVKPVHTLDLVVLGVEWGSGRRQGWLSNIHLGARDPDTGELVMVGKTFKGLTDEMLAWQTERFLSLETGRDGHVVLAAARAGRRDRPRRRADARPATRAAWPCASPASAATATTRGPTRPTPSTPCGRCSRAAPASDGNDDSRPSVRNMTTTDPANETEPAAGLRHVDLLSPWPAGMRAMGAFDRSVREATTLEPSLVHLVKQRASLPPPEG